MAQFQRQSSVSNLGGNGLAHSNSGSIIQPSLDWHPISDGVTGARIPRSTRAQSKGLHVSKISEPLNLQQSSKNAAQTPYEKLLQNELNNPIVSHSFDPIGGKFSKENKSATALNQMVAVGGGLQTQQKRKAKAKVIVKSSLFPIPGQNTQTQKAPSVGSSPKQNAGSQQEFYTTFGKGDFQSCYDNSDQRVQSQDHFSSAFESQKQSMFEKERNSLKNELKPRTSNETRRTFKYIKKSTNVANHKPAQQDKHVLVGVRPYPTEPLNGASIFNDGLADQAIGQHQPPNPRTMDCRGLESLTPSHQLAALHH